jgi:hypothetical protein
MHMLPPPTLANPMPESFSRGLADKPSDHKPVQSKTKKIGLLRHGDRTLPLGENARCAVTQNQGAVT